MQPYYENSDAMRELCCLGHFCQHDPGLSRMPDAAFVVVVVVGVVGNRCSWEGIG